MAPNIFGENFLSRSGPAWHNKGQSWVGDITPSEAAKRVLGWKVATFPQSIRTKRGAIPTGQRAIVREPIPTDDQYRIFGYCTDDWHPIQNDRLGRILDPLAKAGLPVETAFALGHGETVVFCLRADTILIGGDECRGYLTVANYHTGDKALRALFARVRTVCQNTLNAAISSAMMNFNIHHTKAGEDDLKLHVDIFSRMQQARESYDEALKSLVLKKVTDAQVGEILARVYPEPAKPQKVRLLDELIVASGGLRKTVEAAATQDTSLARLLASTEEYMASVDRARELREAARELYDRFCADFGRTAGTGWAVYNAVVELEDFRKGRGDTAGSVLFGERARAKYRAFDVVSSLS